VQGMQSHGQWFGHRQMTVGHTVRTRSTLCAGKVTASGTPLSITLKAELSQTWRRPTRQPRAPG
jgi:hypothetical protein